MPETKKSIPWKQFLKTFHSNNPSLSLKEAMKQASAPYKRQKA